MSEGWEDCPVLPVGWKRREVFRRSGATVGKSDTYYRSPTSERFRSKVELVKYFGDSLDLTYFDFKKGIILPQNTKIRRAVKRSSTISSEGQERHKRRALKKKAKVAPTRTPIPTPSEPKVGSTTAGLDSEPMDTLIACCEDCQQWVPGVMFGPRKRKFKFYCAECRARRRELGRKMNYYKRFGCGECAGCTVATDCGVCRGCLFRSSEPAKTWKCVKRRCHKLRDIKAETTCRNTTVKPKRDIKAETTCRNTTVQPKKKVKSQFEGLKKAMKKVKRETQTVVKKPPRKIKPEPPVVEEAVLEEVKQEEEEQEEVVELHKIECPKQEPSSPMPEETAQETPLQLVKTSRNRRNTRSCGECEACLRPVDCGSCDFCKDKAKFGGFNTLRQKCRWKQCLQFASKRLLPREAQQSGPDRKETGYRTGHRRWRENAFATRKVARVIQAAKKRKIWQAFPSAPEARVTDAGQEMQEERGPHKHTSSLGDVRQVQECEGRETAHTFSHDSQLRPQRDISNLQAPEKLPLKTSPLSEAHERPTVIKETCSERMRRQSLEETGIHRQMTSVLVKQDTSEHQAERLQTAMLPCDPEPASHCSLSPGMKRDLTERHASRKCPQPSPQERDSGELSALIVSPVSRNGKRERAPTSNRQPGSPKRSAEPDIRDPGVPSNSRIIRASTPEQSPGYGRSAPTTITQIFSLGSPYMMMNLEPLLRNFMQDLMLLPLPASWVVCSSLGPDVQLLQLSRKSPVWDAVVQIRPSFTFHVLVRGLAVPLGHRLYRNHPATLSSVDDVVELIGDLETYRVCAGYPQHRNAKPPPAALAALLPRERSAYCQVLVDKEHCFQCSGSL